MIKKRLVLSIVFLLILVSSFSSVFASSNHECRFWTIMKMNDDANIENVINYQLLSENMNGVADVDYMGGPETSMRDLGLNMNHGWSMVYYNQEGKDYYVHRSPYSAYSDQPFPTESELNTPHLMCLENNSNCNFRNYVHFIVAPENPFLATLHLRKATSGIIPDSGNPHNFIKKTSSAENWVFGHNGNVDKNILLNLIDPFYLNKFEIEYGSRSDISSLIDSELLFIYILENIEEYRYDIKKALTNIITNLVYQDISYYNGNINFYLTNGEEIWYFNSYNGGDIKTYQLQYKLNENYVAVSSEKLNDDSAWQPFPDYSLGVVKKGEGIGFVPINDIVVKGSVVGDNEVISNAQIILHLSNEQEYSTFSDDFGRFNFNDIPQPVFPGDNVYLEVSYSNYPDKIVYIDSLETDYFEVELKQRQTGWLKFIFGIIFAIIIIVFVMRRS